MSETVKIVSMEPGSYTITKLEYDTQTDDALEDDLRWDGFKPPVVNGRRMKATTGFYANES